jgi:hypothetical protein
MADVDNDTNRRRRAWLGVGAGALVAAGTVVAVWFQPQKLFIDDTVDEPLPGLVTPAPEPSPSTTTLDDEMPGEEMPGEVAVPTTAPTTLADFTALAVTTGVPQVVSSAAFVGLDHATSGTALVVALADGSVVVRFEDLDTENGPDLHVVLTPHAPDSGQYGDRIELGRLKGNRGDQNYVVPNDLDWSSVRSVVVWCDRFSSPFGAAAISVPV